MMVHISYKGIPGAISDTLSGAVSLTIQGPLGVIPHMKMGRLRALAVISAKRSPAFPELPTIQEGGVSNYAFTNSPHCGAAASVSAPAGRAIW